jgi:hypothetical protein
VDCVVCAGRSSIVAVLCFLCGFAASAFFCGFAASASFCGCAAAAFSCGLAAAAFYSGIAATALCSVAASAFAGASCGYVCCCSNLIGVFDIDRD